MIKIENEGREYLLIPLPDEHSDRRYFMCRPSLNVLAYTHDDREAAFIKLPEGEWEMFAFASSITEPQVLEIVEPHHQFWRNYGNDMKICFSPIHSLESLLTSHGLKMEGTLILVKQ